MIGQILGSVAGSYLMGNATKKAAKMDAAAQRYAADKTAQGYDDARPYITDAYSRGQGFLNDQLAAGAYGGDTYAGMDPMTTQGYNYLSNFGQNAMGMGQGFVNQGQGFGTNYQDIYNRASGPTMDNAINYAMNNPMVDGMVNAAMRDSRRQLEEEQLPGINMAASASNNANASRAGLADYKATRGYQDREADVRAGILSDMVNQYRSQNNVDINNMLSANAGLRGTFDTGFGMVPGIANMMVQPGQAFQADQQARLDDARARFERNRDFGMDALNAYNAGILGQAPRTTMVAPITANPYTAQIGGMMSGFGFGGNIGKSLDNYFANRTPAPTPQPVSYNRDMPYTTDPGGF